MGLLEHRRHQNEPVSVYVVTLSDTRDVKTDASGTLIQDLCQNAGFEVVGKCILKEDKDKLGPALSSIIKDSTAQALILNGGTGISPRDCIYEVLQSMYERPLPGFGELFRMLSFQEIGSASLLSRASAGVVADKLLFSIPGSPNAVNLAMEKLILPELRHLVRELQRRPPQEAQD